jgi:predicted Ser/Thr protein kinase
VAVTEEFVRLQVLKTDDLGSIEHGTLGGREVIRRRAALGLVAPVTKWLLGREARALARLMERGPKLAGVAELLEVRGGRELFRSWIPGQPLHRATRLPANFFELLEELVRELHRRGVAHNDLHKEPNVLVTPEGRPALVDFQLASVHRLHSGGLRRRAAEDLRHVRKHAARYAAQDSTSRSTARERGLVARLWMATGKPLYNLVTRRLIRRPDAEGRRPRGGPWPEWDPPL